MNKRFLRVIAVVALQIAVSWALPARPQSPPLPTPQTGKCWVTIALRTVRLKVDQAWLRAGEANPLSLFQGCPTSPVPVDSFYLSPAVMKEFNAPEGLDQRGFLLHVSPSPGPFSPSVFDASGPLEASMTMAAHGPNDPLIIRYGRHYDLYYDRYPNDPEQLHETVDCNGPAGMERECGSGRPQEFSGLVARYFVGQTLGVPEVLSTDPKTEPGAILQFDKGLRKWLVGLEVDR